MSSSDEFFNQSLSPPGQPAALKSRKTRAAPPPPPPARSNVSSASSYYGSASTRQQRPTTTSNATTSRSTAPPPPRRPAATSAAATSSSTMRHSSSSTAAAPTFYGNTSATGGYSSSSYYGTPAPAAAYTSSSTMNAFPNSTSSSAAAAPAAVADASSLNTSTSDEWYSAPAASTFTSTHNEWYSAPQQQQQQPAYTDFTQKPAQQQQQYNTEMAASSNFIMNTTTSSNAHDQFSTFTPSPLQQQPATMQSSSDIYKDDYENEPPILEELGINMQHILLKTRAVVLPFSKLGVTAQQVMHEEDNDLAGPLVFALLLGGELLLTGKFSFSYIYGFCMFGCCSMTLVLNLMSPRPVSIWTVASILGYALLPVNVLAIIKIFLVHLAKLARLGDLVAVLTIAWCTVASTRLLEQKCDMRAQRYLLAYPIALLYSAFVMITIF